MSSQTTNLNLIKPDSNDSIDIDDINDNMDILDAEVSNKTNTRVKGNSESSYRTGSVNLTSIDIGSVDKTGDTMTGPLNIKTHDITRDNVPAANVWSLDGLWLQDSQGAEFGHLRAHSLSDGYEGVQLEAHREFNGGTSVNHALRLEIDENGNRRVNVHDQEVWLTGLNAVNKSGDTMTGPLINGPFIIPRGNGNYNEGIRVNRVSSGGWAVITLGGLPDSTSGTSDYQWFIGSPPTDQGRQLRICHNASGASTYFSVDGNNNTVSLNSSGALFTKRTDYNASTTPSSSLWMDSVVGVDSAGAGRFNLRQVAHADGYQGVQLEAHRVINSTNYYNGLRMEINASGARRVVVSEAAPWRSAIGAAPDTAITNITRSGTTFTATRANGGTFTFSQQDNNTTYSAGGGLSLSGTTFKLAADCITFVVKSFTTPTSSGSKSYGFGAIIPSGYKLNPYYPVNIQISGDASSYVTDNSLSVSGTSVTLNYYLVNAQSRALTLKCVICFVRNP